MLIYTNRKDYKKELVPMYVNRFTIDYITDRKYGDHTSLEKIDIVKKVNKENRLISRRELIKEGLLNGNPRDRNRFNNLVEIEDIVSKKCDYMYIRIDLYPDKDLDVSDSDFILIVDRFNKDIERIDWLNDCICSSISNIELSNTNKWHLHHGMMIDLSNIEEKDSLGIIEKILNHYTVIIDSENSKLHDCSMNIVDLSKFGSENKYYRVERNNYKKRNNIYLMFCYHCKDSYGKKSDIELFKNRDSNKLFNIHLNTRFITYSDLEDDWYNKLEDGLLDLDSIRIYRNRVGRNELSIYRIKQIFDLEDTLFDKCDKYTVVSMNIRTNNSNTELLECLELFNRNRRNKIFDEYYIGYNWSIDCIDSRWIMQMNLFLDCSNDEIPRIHIDNILLDIRNWYYKVDKSITVEYTGYTDFNNMPVIAIDNIKERNIVRHRLVRLAIINRETRAYIDSGVLIKGYGQSKI